MYRRDTKRDLFQKLPSEDGLRNAVKVLQEHDIVHVLSEWFFCTAQQQLHSQVVPLFWSHFKSALCDTDVITAVCMSIEELHGSLSSYWPSLEQLTVVQSYVSDHMFDHVAYREGLTSRLQLLFKAIIFSCPRKHFQDAMYQFYVQAFKAFNQSRKGSGGTPWKMSCFIRCVMAIVNINA